MDNFYELQEKLNVHLCELDDEISKKDLVFKHLQIALAIKTPIKIPELFNSADQEWLNTSVPLTWTSHLSGKVLVLDFFTYCCINCLHILPALRRLETRFGADSGLAVLGIHSAKFLHEKATANVASAILQNDIQHPVLNDPEACLWKKLRISCWPTLLILGPEGDPLFCLMGESNEDTLVLFCETALEFFKSRDQLKECPLPLRLLSDPASQSPLRFPGKVAWDSESRIIVLADTGNNRILILTEQGVVKMAIGGQDQGFEDGSFEQARFNRPQGIAIRKSSHIYVADTENHAIRLIDLPSQRVTTVAGTGEQGFDREGGGSGSYQPISSPWDLCIAPPIGSGLTAAENGLEDSVLYVAMAGLHQIWALVLEDCLWLKGSRPLKSGTCLSVAGSGKEENRNNAYPHRAGFAQPSGLCYSTTQRCLFVADSESSSVRTISLVDGHVKALVGGDRDPDNLFAFGDQDGVGMEAKLQHPLGVTWAGHSLYVADTYNRKIKVVDPSTKLCEQFISDCDLGELGGICAFTDDHLLVTDTQQHAILKVPLDKSLKPTQLPIVFLSDSGTYETDGPSRKSISCESVRQAKYSVRLCPGGRLIILLSVTLGEGVTYSQGAPQSWALRLPTGSECPLKCVGASKGNLGKDLTHIVLQASEELSEHSPHIVKLSGKVYICDVLLNVCLPCDSEWTIEVFVDPTSSTEEVLNISWQVSK